MAFNIIAVQMVKDTSFTDIIQGKSVTYNRTFAKEGSPQKVRILQKTPLVKDAVNASNSALRTVSALELESILRNGSLRKHNADTYRFFTTFKPTDVAGSEYNSVFKLVAEIEKAKADAIEKTKTEKGDSADK